LNDLISFFKIVIFRGVNRQTIVDYKFENITIPSGMVIQIPVHTIIHDPEYWDNPELFLPQRSNLLWISR
jgi:cytochrome P450